MQKELALGAHASGRETNDVGDVPHTHQQPTNTRHGAEKASVEAVAENILCAQLSSECTRLFVEQPVSPSKRGAVLLLPDELLPDKMVEIILSNAQLQGVPSTVVRAVWWSALTRLDLSSNRIKVLPSDHESWARMPSLRELNVSHNQIRAVPCAIEAATELASLNLRSNDLRNFEAESLPSLLTLHHLKFLDLRYNRRLRGLEIESLISAAGQSPSGRDIQVLVGAEKGVAPRRGNALTKVFPGDGPDGGWPSLTAQLTPLTTPEMHRRLRYFFQDATTPENASRDCVVEALLSHYESLKADRPLPRCRTEVHYKGIPLPNEIYARLLLSLREVEWPDKSDRSKVSATRYLVLERPPPGDLGDSQGARRSRLKREKHSDLWEAVLEAMNLLDPEFSFTGVACTHGFRGSPHCDNQDISYQWAMSLGDFDGGALCVESSPGEVSVVDTRARAAKVDGRYPHWVAPWVGDRFSLICYKTRGEPTGRGPAVYSPSPPPGCRG